MDDLVVVDSSPRTATDVRRPTTFLVFTSPPLFDRRPTPDWHRATDARRHRHGLSSSHHLIRFTDHYPFYSLSLSLSLSLDSRLLSTLKIIKIKIKSQKYFASSQNFFFSLRTRPPRINSWLRHCPHTHAQSSPCETALTNSTLSIKNRTQLKIQIEMAMNYIKPLRSLTKEVLGGVMGRRTFAVGGKAKKGKGGGASDAPKASSLSKEVKATTVVGANILKEGTDPKILADSEYPDWLWNLLDKKPALSELRRKKIEDLPYEDLKRFVKLDNRARIKENNSVRAKN